MLQADCFYHVNCTLDFASNSLNCGHLCKILSYPSRINIPQYGDLRMKYDASNRNRFVWNVLEKLIRSYDVQHSKGFNNIVRFLLSEHMRPNCERSLIYSCHPVIWIHECAWCKVIKSILSLLHKFNFELLVFVSIDAAPIKYSYFAIPSNANFRCELLMTFKFAQLNSYRI